MVEEFFPHCGVEAAVAHAATYPARKREYGSALAWLIEIGRGLSGTDYQKIILHRYDLRGRVQAMFESIDLLVIPVQPFASPTLQFMTRIIKEPELLPACCAIPCRST